MARLLIIDDNANIRFLMRSYIEHSGHVVCGEAHGGVEGIELAKKTQPDLILLDFAMPTMSGAETAAVLKQMLPDTPIILFTLHGEEINKKFAATMGADLVVSKADGIPKIAESVKILLERKTPAGQSGDGASAKSSETSLPPGKDQKAH